MIITERRWQCDFCGVVSPVTTTSYAPQGWVEAESTVTVALVNVGQMLHFCCDYHRTLWVRDNTDNDL